MKIFRRNLIFFLPLLLLCLLGASSCTNYFQEDDQLQIQTLTNSKPKKIAKMKAVQKKKVDLSKLKVYATMKDWRKFLKTKQVSVSDVNSDIYKLNNEELVELGAIETEVLESINLADNMKSHFIVNNGVDGFLASLNNAYPEQVRDTVNTKLAANSKNPGLKTKSVDDLVFFDYPQIQENKKQAKNRHSTEENPLNSDDDESKISDTVQRAIQREMKNSMNETTRMPSAKFKATVNQVVNSYKDQLKDRVGRRASGILKKHIKKTNKEINPFPDPEPFIKENTKSIVKVMKVSLNKKKHVEMRNFQFIPNYNQNLSWEDLGEGYIEFSGIYKNEYASLNGVIVGANIKKLNVSLALEAEDRDFELIAFDDRDFDNFLDNQKLRGLGGHVLVQLSEDIEDVDLGDSEYEERFYFTEDFKLIKEITGAAYILFIGVEPGNTLLGYKHSSGKIAEKIILVVDDELFYDEGFIIKGKRAVFSIWETNVMGNENRELNIDGKLIKYFNRDVNAKNLALNHYEINTPYLPYGSRYYYKLEHISDDMFVGSWDLEDLYIPSREFIVQVFNSLEIEELEGRCLIQLNLSSKPRTIEVDSRSGDGSINFDVTFLDSMGLFSGDVTPITKKVFIIGEGQGVIDLKVNYLDGEADFIQTYCNGDIYLIEQL